MTHRHPTGFQLRTGQRQYDRGGYGEKLAGVRDAKNQKTGYDYDMWGRLAAEILYSGTTTHSEHARAEYAYDVWDRVVEATSFSGIPSRMTYDAKGRLERKVIWNNIPSAGGVASVTMTYNYNDKGQLASLTIDDASGCGCTETKFYQYDDDGRMTGHTGVVSSTTMTYEYEPSGQLASFEYNQSSTSTISLEYDYDALGRLTAVTETGQAGPAAEYAYNRAGQIVAATWENGAHAVYAYDAYGRVDAVFNYDVNGSVMSGFDYRYNLDGLRTSVAREDGSVTYYQYDGLNRLKKEERIAALKDSALEFDDSNSTYVTFPGAYNHYGDSALTIETWVRTGTNLTDYQVFLSKNGPFQLILRNANFRGAIITTQGVWEYAFGSTTLQTNTWYHVALIYEQGAANPIRLYLNGSLEATGSLTGTLTGNGRLNFGGRGLNGAPTELFFQGRLDEVRLSNAVRDVPALWAAGVYHRELMPDADTVGLWHCNEGEGSTVADSSVTGANGTLGSGSAAPAWTKTVSWRNTFAYDVAGNRTRWDKFNGSATSTYSYDYDTLNQLTHYSLGVTDSTFTYDLNGNRATQQFWASGTHYYTRYFRWDQDDRLIRYEAYNEQTSTTEKTVVYTYCRTCGGQRTGRIAYDAAGNVVEWLRYEMEGLNHLRIDEVWDADDNGYLDDPATSGDEWRVQRVYVNGQGQLGQIVKVIVYDYTGGSTTATPYYYGYDVLGNVSVISGGNGQELDQFEQDAFGNLVSGNWVTRIGNITEQITTKQYDMDLGLYYFNARWYDALLGLFLSRDVKIGMRPTSIRLKERCKSCASGLPLLYQLSIALNSMSTAHPYSICGQAPIMFVDASGEFPWAAVIIGYIAAAGTYCAYEAISLRNDLIAKGFRADKASWASHCMFSCCLTRAVPGGGALISEYLSAFLEGITYVIELITWDFNETDMYNDMMAIHYGILTCSWHVIPFLNYISCKDCCSPCASW